MLSFLGGFKGLVNFKRCLIDNTTFQLHYKYTFGLLCIASLLTTAKQYFGDPIDCIVDGVPGSVFKTYCWIHGTFTLPSQLTGRQGRDFPHPGVGPYPSSDPGLVEVTEEGDEIRHAWYQWVVFVLGFQAILCYLPHFLWKSWEGGKLSLLLQNLDENTLDTEPETTKDRRSVIVNYVLRNIRTHNLYVYKFIFCEFLNLVNIIGQMYLMDAFFGGQFTTYGSEVLSVTGMDMEKRVDPMAKVFPKMSKCTFHKYGPSGTIQNHDGLCILPINIINEKIYVFLWFWYLALITWTCVFFCFRVVTIVSKYSRYLVFCGRSKSSNRGDVAIVMEKLWFGDWFILMQLCKNMNPMVFHDLVTDLRDRMDPKRADNLEMRNGNTYPTLPLLEKPQAPYMDTP
eukprot:GFUD01039015.1.p1 GENE.GFUD01039015.1~~GFUD01039015.1.p1  ORF type:complete len:398 (-),score=70.77 GFUD01039015.1:273-1466(-)